MNKERGFVLPIVLILTALLATLFLFSIKEWSEWGANDQLRLSMIKANYAAQSGVAFMQSRLKAKPDDHQSTHTKIGEFVVDTTSWETESGTVMIQSVAIGKDGVKQTIMVEVEQSTFQIKRWLE